MFNIKKIFLATFWIAIASGMLVLLIAAIGKKNKQHCQDYIIKIKGNQDKFFMDKTEVLRILNVATAGNIKGKAIADFNLRRVEDLVERNAWIKDAELYFDNQDVLHITVKEREPIARLFTTGGNSFYIDSSCSRMPLSDRLSARVPVFTNFPEKKFPDKKDSTLMSDIKSTAEYIMKHEFWMAQAEQLDITPQYTFEMVPTIGNHIVKLGDGNDIDKKFHRLFIFYKEILSKTGFDKYSILDAQYKGQLVATRKQ